MDDLRVPQSLIYFNYYIKSVAPVHSKSYKREYMLMVIGCAGVAVPIPVERFTVPFTQIPSHIPPVID